MIGTAAVDSIAAANGTYIGTVNLGALSAAGLGSSADLSGGYIDVPVVGSFVNRTAEVWLQLDAGGAGCCTSIASSGTWQAQALHWNLVGGNVFEHAVNGQGNSNTLGGSFVTDGATWYHLVVTQSAGDTATYLNGVAVADNGVNHAGPIDYGNNNLQIGAWNGDRLLDGRIDEFAIYDTALTASQVSAHYAAGIVPEPSTGLLALLDGILVLRRRRR